MSDYNPNLPPNPDRDPRNYQRDMDQDGNGRGLTLIVGILVAIVILLVGGLGTVLGRHFRQGKLCLYIYFILLMGY